MRNPTFFILSFQSLKSEVAVFVVKFAVYADFGVFAHVADHIPVDGACVFAACFGVACAQCHVEGAADFLVEENLTGEFVDLEVGADGEFAQIT